MENNSSGAPSVPADEPVFVNVTHMDRERYFEAVRARAKSGRNLALTAGGVIAAAAGLLMASRWVAVLGVVIFALTAASPGVIGRRDYSRLCERHPGGRWEKTVRFYPDRLETDDGNGNIAAAAYADIRRECAYKRMYVLDFGSGRPATAFDTEGFTKGSIDGLRDFLTEARRAAYDPAPDEADDAPTDA